MEITNYVKAVSLRTKIGKLDTKLEDLSHIDTIRLVKESKSFFNLKSISEDFEDKQFIREIKDIQIGIIRNLKQSMMQLQDRLEKEFNDL